MGGGRWSDPPRRGPRFAPCLVHQLLPEASSGGGWGAELRRAALTPAEWAQLAYGVPATFALLGHLLLGCGVAYALWFFCCTPDEL